MSDVIQFERRKTMFKVTTFDKSLDYEDIAKKAMGRCVKRPVTHGCFLLHECMTFHNETGTQVGHPGMIAIVGSDHAWPVTADYFKAHYDTIEGRNYEETIETKA